LICFLRFSVIVDKICKGSIEYTLDNKTRVDCQLSNESQEYDWQNKWHLPAVSYALVVTPPTLLPSNPSSSLYLSPVPRLVFQSACLF
jgi:hypothetical protein